MHTLRNTALAFLLIVAAATTRADNNAATVEITATDSLRFNVTKIEARPGEKIHLVFHNGGSLPKNVMGHNWVLLKAEVDPNAYATAAVLAKTEDYEPKMLAREVIAEIPLLGAGETGEVTFAAPSTPGKYPFLCSSPGHCAAGMRGFLIVK